MNSVLIRGGRSIQGEIQVSGAKNSAVAIIPASLLFNGTMRYYNTPDILDIKWLGDILLDLGIDFDYDGYAFSIRSEAVVPYINSESAKEYRGSYYFMGVLLSRYKQVRINLPGGCKIGKRPIDYHLSGMEALGAIVSYDEDGIILKAESLKAAEIELPKKSVGATINLVLAAVYAKGQTIIKNASLEPEIDDLISFLNKAGVSVRRDKDTITIIGLEEVKSIDVRHEFIPDRIEAMTYIIAGLLSGEVTVRGVNYRHLQAPLYTLLRANANIEIGDTYIRACCSDIDYFTILTQEYPGCPTDILQIMVILMIKNNGGEVVETIFEDRFNSLQELRKAGANIEIRDNHARIRKSIIQNTHLQGLDLRGTASLVLAGLISDEVIVDNFSCVERGYSNFANKLRSLGAVLLDY